MGIPLAEQLTTSFYLWEQRGRGWQVWDQPVKLEPPFEPFLFHALAIQPSIDDGRKPTFLSTLVESVSSPFQGEDEQEEIAIVTEPPFSIEPPSFIDNSQLYEISVALSANEKITADQAEHFLLTLSICSLPISYEIVGTSNTIAVQLTCRECDLAQVKQELRAYFPGAIFEVKESSLKNLTSNSQKSVVIDFGLSEEFMRPLKRFSQFEPDPLIGIIGALEHLHEGEMGMLQILFQATHNPWAESIIRSVSDGEGGSFFADAPDMVQLAREKTRRPLFACIIRVIGRSFTSDRAWRVAKALASGLTQVAEPLSNGLIPLENNGYNDDTHFENVLQRQTHRSGILLNSEELIALVHLPSASVQSEKMQRITKKTKAAPSIALGHKLILGENIHQNKSSLVSLSLEQRLMHMYVIGTTGTGKSTLLHNLIVQDIEQDHGVAVIDPHGDLIERVISCIPAKRMRDVVQFDPSDSENPFGINILSAKNEAEKNVAASDLVAVFQRMSTSWGDQMTVLLGNAIQAFLESERGGTLLDLRKFLIEDEFRKEFLKTVRDQEVRYFWEKQHHVLRGNTLGSILTRLDTFLRPKIIRRIIAPKIELQFDDVMNQGKILLVRLSQGLMGEENSTLLGTLIVSKLHQAAMARQILKAKERAPFFLYVDEFQNFITPSLSGVLSGTRKYGLGLILAHQDLRQIFNQDTGVANSVISNPGTRICFRVGDLDAEKLQDGFTHFKARDLQNLGLGEAIARVERSDNDFNLKIFPPLTVNSDTAKARLKRVINLSHEQYQSEISSEDREFLNNTKESLAKQVSPPIIRTDDNSIKGSIPLREQEVIYQTTELPTLPQIIEDQFLSQHRYLQALIKRMAEERGYKAIVEAPTPDGKGRVDVLLERNEEKIACEISITTSGEQELHNIEKCLKAEYNKIIVCCIEKRRLEKIRAFVMGKLNATDQNRVLFIEPKALFNYFEQTTFKEVIEEQRMKGYRVRVQYETTSGIDRERKREAVAEIVLKSFRKMKDTADKR